MKPEDRWRDMCAEACDVLDRLRKDGPALVRRATIKRVDGFPSGSTGGARGATARRDDDEGDAGDGHADPVGNLVAAELGRDHDPDVLKAAVNDMLVHLAATLRAARTARRALDRALTLGELASTDKPAKADEAPGCISCARFEIYAIAVKAGRCWACYMWRRRHDLSDAPARVILARPENATRRALLGHADVVGFGGVIDDSPDAVRLTG